MSFVDFFRQLGTLIGLPVVVVAGALAALIVIVRDWRAGLLSYALLSVLLAVLLARVIPVDWALLQAIAGGLVAVMLYLSARQLGGRRDGTVPAEARWPQMASLTGFRLLAVLLAGAAFFALRERIHLPVVDALLQDAIIWLLLVGLLGLALHEEPLHAGLALLTVLGGFELFLFSLVQRRMLVGLLVGGQVLLGLAVSYLVLSRGLARPVRDGDSSGRPA